MIGIHFGYGCIYRSHIYQTMESYPLPVTNVEQMLYPTEAIHQRNKVCCIKVIAVQ